MYNFLTGFMFWVSIATFFIGLSVRFVLYFRGLDWQMDRVAYKSYPLQGVKGALKSVLHWLVPFLTHGWRRKSFMTVAFFAFHVGATIVPFFLLAHNVFIRTKIGAFHFIVINQTVADILSWLVVIGAAMLIIRRIVLPEARVLSGVREYLRLLLSVAPFITGLCARYETGDYSFWLYLPIISGEI